MLLGFGRAGEIVAQTSAVARHRAMRGHAPRCRESLAVGRWPHFAAFTLTRPETSARVRPMTDTVDSIFDEYARRYSERDVEGVAELCLWPFLAIREGVAIHMTDREAVRDHFASMIDAYRGAGVATWKPGRDRYSPARRARGLHHRSLERARRGGAGTSGHAHDVPPARDARRMALPLVHESLLRGDASRTKPL